MPTSYLPEFSVVIAMYDEENVLPLLVERLRAVRDGICERYEVVPVDDGSRDATPQPLFGISRTWPQPHTNRLPAIPAFQPSQESPCR